VAGKGAEAEPERRSRVKDGFMIASKSHVIMLLLLMVAAVTIADDPVQVLGPALASNLGVSQSWSGWFIAALGAGSVAGSLRRPKHKPRLRLAATVLAALGVCMVVFVSTPWVWVSFGAAIAAGATCLLANSMTRTLLSKTAGANQASVMAIYAIAWAGSKPIASLTDGALAGLIGVQATGIILVLPAFVPIALLTARAWLPKPWLVNVWPFTVWPETAPRETAPHTVRSPDVGHAVTGQLPLMLPGPVPAPLESALLIPFIAKRSAPHSQHQQIHNSGNSQFDLKQTDDNKALVTHNQV